MILNHLWVRKRDEWLISIVITYDQIVSILGTIDTYYAEVLCLINQVHRLKIGNVGSEYCSMFTFA